MFPRLFLVSCLFWLSDSQKFHRPHQPVRTVNPGQPPILPVSSRVVNATNHFSFSLFETILPEHQKDNVILSGTTLSSALAMLFLGARNLTEIELTEALQYRRFGLDQTTVHGGFKELLDKFRGSVRNEAPYVLEIVNLVLVQNGYPIVRDYQTLLNDFYQARIQNVDFEKEGEATMNKVNEFVAHTTRNQISSVLKEPLDPKTKAFLMNAVYFKGEWKTRFDQRFTRPSTFYVSGIRPRTVPMMNMKSKFLFADVPNLDSEALELPYKGDDLAMLVVLPKQREGLAYLEKVLLKDPAILDPIYRSLQEVIVDVSLPRFNIESQIDLIKPLKALGAHSAFDPDLADLSGIGGHRDLFVTKAFHQAVFKVDEEGSEASVFSGIATGTRIGGPRALLFTVDHPFLFFIRDKVTGSILFMGRISDP